LRSSGEEGSGLVSMSILEGVVAEGFEGGGVRGDSLLIGFLDLDVERRDDRGVEVLDPRDLALLEEALGMVVRGFSLKGVL
jgi:hypothetical protein